MPQNSWVWTVAAKIVSVYSLLLLHDSLLDGSIRSMPCENVKGNSVNVSILNDIGGSKTVRQTSR